MILFEATYDNNGVEEKKPITLETSDKPDLNNWSEALEIAENLREPGFELSNLELLGY